MDVAAMFVTCFVAFCVLLGSSIVGYAFSESRRQRREIHRRLDID
jgi:ABC-type glycerol-3-phosphate transport system permease component